MNEELLVISKDEMPSNKMSVAFREPTYKDRVQSTKRVPENNNMGYSMPQLLMSLCIEKINNKKIAAQRDPIGNIRAMATEDTMFMLIVFRSAFFLDDDYLPEIKDLAERLRGEDSKQSYTIAKEDMPSGELGITFRAPSTGDQIDLDRRYSGLTNTGYSFEEFFLANMVTHVNGEEVKENDPVKLMGDWSQLDAEFAQTVFLQMNFIDQEVREKANELGKKWRKRRPSTKKSSKVQADTMDTEESTNT